MGTVFFSLKKLIPLFELFLEPADRRLHLQAAAPAEICLFISLIVEKKENLFNFCGSVFKDCERIKPGL